LERLFIQTDKFTKESFTKAKGMVGANIFIRMEMFTKANGLMERNPDLVNIFLGLRKNSLEYGATIINFMVSIKI